MVKKSRGKSLYKSPPRRLWNRFEISFGGRLAFYFYFFIKAIHNLSFKKYLLFSKLRNKQLIQSKYSSTGFYYYFLKLDLKKAYKIRIKQAINLEENGNRLEKELAKNYLDSIYDSKLASVFNFNQRIQNYLIERNRSEKIFKFNNKEKKESILFLGPSSDPKIFNFDRYSHICFTKPVPLKEYDLPDKKVILVLNNIWSINKKEIIKEWSKSYPRAMVFSPKKVGLINENNSIHNEIISFPFFSGLMGLQRALIILLKYYNVKKINVEGFDFQLSKIAYKPWYPSLFSSEGFESHNHMILFANMRHDFILNYLYTKNLYRINKNILTGGILKYLNTDLEIIINKFIKKLS
jgi:hypothetical protein